MLKCMPQDSLRHASYSMALIKIKYQCLVIILKGEAGMPLTVKDILEKTFKRSFKGYDEDEVDKFLDQIIDELKALLEENASLKEEISAAVEQVNKIKHSEETIMKTLISAQKTAERIISEATHKAELIISSAESTSRERAEKTTKELAESQSRLEELRACAQGFAASFANMINAQAAYFEETYRSYFGGETDPLGGINTDALERIDKDIAKSLNGIDVSVSQAETQEENINTNADDTEFAPEVSDIKETGSKEELENEPDSEKQEQSQDSEQSEKGFMELNEINKALTEIEKGSFTDEYEGTDTVLKSSDSEAYGDYSWLYDAEKPEPTIKDQKEQEELKSLIDEVLE